MAIRRRWVSEAELLVQDTTKRQEEQEEMVTYVHCTGTALTLSKASRCLLYYCKSEFNDYRIHLLTPLEAREDATRLRGLIDKDAAAAEKRLMAESKKQPDVEFDETELDRAKVRCINSYKFVSWARCCSMRSQCRFTDYRTIQLQQYLESDRICRHVAICRYFGEDIDEDNDEVRRAYCDNMCDVSSPFTGCYRTEFTLIE